MLMYLVLCTQPQEKEKYVQSYNPSHQQTPSMTDTALQDFKVLEGKVA